MKNKEINRILDLIKNRGTNKSIQLKRDTSNEVIEYLENAGYTIKKIGVKKIIFQ